MADQTITPVSCTLDTFATLASGNYASLNANDAGVISNIPDDGKYVLHIKVTAAGGATVTIKAGDGNRSGIGDLSSGALAQNAERLICLESARFKKLTGADKGKIRITTTGATSVACFKVA